MIAVLAAGLTKFGLGFLVSNRVSYLILSFFIEKWVNNLANGGVILLNTRAMMKTTGITEEALINAWAAADKVILGAALEGKTLNEEKIKEVDDAVFDAFVTHAVFV